MEVCGGCEDIGGVVSVRSIGAWGAVWVRVIAAKVDCEDEEPGAREEGRLLLPTLFIEASAVNQKQRAPAAPVEIPLNLRGLA